MTTGADMIKTNNCCFCAITKNNDLSNDIFMDACEKRYIYYKYMRQLYPDSIICTTCNNYLNGNCIYCGGLCNIMCTNDKPWAYIYDNNICIGDCGCESCHELAKELTKNFLPDHSQTQSYGELAKELIKNLLSYLPY